MLLGVWDVKSWFLMIATIWCALFLCVLGVVVCCVRTV